MLKPCGWSSVLNARKPKQSSKRWLRLASQVAEPNRLSDLDIAVEWQPKEADWERLRALTQQRVEQLQMAGRRFRNWLEMECYRHLDAFSFLKAGSRG